MTHTTVRSLQRLRVALPAGPARIVLGLSWLAVLPAATWAVYAIYVPLLGASLSARMAWLAAVAIVAGVLAGSLLHALAHLGAARAFAVPVPPLLPLYPLGDAAQVWPPAPDARAEAVVASAGPVGSVAAAAIAVIAWRADVGTFVTVVSFFLVCFHLAVAIVNLVPGFPFDGGRLIRAVARGVLGDAALGQRWAWALGVLWELALVAWAAFLAAQRARFSAETALGTLAIAGLGAVPLIMQRAPAVEAPRPPGAPPGATRAAGRVLLVACVLALAVPPVLLLPVNAGLEAPGPTAEVSPMVHVPPDRAHTPTGTLLLTTVIPQAPIVVAEWLYAHLDPAVRLTSARQIVPPSTTPQQLAIQGFRDLQQSEKTAIVVGLQLAGFDARLRFEGAEVVGIAAESHANGLLRLGDEIVSVNGKPVATASDVSRLLAAAPGATSVDLVVRRQGSDVAVRVPLLAPAQGSDTPRIGINVSPTGDQLSLPFPVTITPRKVSGGPSAGLMFTLAVYDAVTPGDLTAGHRVAGTGTIDLEGNVGPIGGIQQKVAAAESAGAEYFLAPPQNYADAVAIAHRIKVVRVATARDALAFLRSLAPAAPRGRRTAPVVPGYG